MSDLEQIKSLLTKCNTRINESHELIIDGNPNAYTIIRAWRGYRCHVEFEFDKDGNILSAGAFEEM